MIASTYKNLSNHQLLLTANKAFHKLFWDILFHDLCVILFLILFFLFQCEDPTTKCSSDDWHIGSAAQQLSRRGPLYVTDRRLNVEIDTANFSGLTRLTEAPENQHSSESPVLHSAHVVMVGVPAEIAVAISIASFLIGAALTGMLCFIHHRKALPKSVSFS